jgi:hypothetical protein
VASGADGVTWLIAASPFAGVLALAEAAATSFSWHGLPAGGCGARRPAALSRDELVVRHGSPNG